MELWNAGNSHRQAVPQWRQPGGSPAGRIRFEGSEVYATRDELTGDVVLSRRPGARSCSEFFALMRTIDVPDEFMADRPMNAPPPEREVLKDE
jgi:antitoxin VapB